MNNKTNGIGFGENTRKTRKKLGITTQELAEACGISRSYLTLIENGKRLPGKKVLPKIAKALGISVTVALNWYLEDLREKFQ